MSKILPATSGLHFEVYQHPEDVAELKVRKVPIE